MSRVAQLQAEATDDSHLVAQVQQGDSKAFNTLVRRYRERLYSVVYNLTGNSEDAADLTQDAFIKAFQSIGNFRGKSAFFTWLYRIAINGAITHMKKHRKGRFYSLENLHEEHLVSTEIVERLTAKARTDKPTLLRELQEKLNDALQTLSLKHRTVIILFEIEGLSHAEIANITGTTEGTVRSRLHYAKQQLQGLLKEYLEQ